MTGDPYTPETDAARKECRELLDRLMLPEKDPNRITAAEFGIRMKKLMAKNDVKVEVIHRAPAAVQKAVEIMGGSAVQIGAERGCKNE